METYGPWESTPPIWKMFGRPPYRRKVTLEYYGHQWVEWQYSPGAA